ncbi:MAG: hypothetical protein HKN12_12420, partial [Gemmatimonadetes bacterium]|nr:hypothetical protein [Gemmatimonadota bacterium]
VRTSARGADARAALGSSVPVLALWQLVVPQFFGDYHTLAKREFWGEFFNEGKGPFFLSISFGVTAFAAMAGALGARFRAAVPWFVAGLAGVLIAMGPHFPPLRPLLGAEGSGWFRWPVKFTFLAAVTWPLVAALGVDALRAGSRRAVAGIGVAGLLLTGAALLGGATMGSTVADGWVAEHVVPLGEVKDVPVILAEVRGRLERAALFAALLVVGAGAWWMATRSRPSAEDGTGGVPARGRTASRIAAVALAAVIAVEMAPPQRDVYRGTPREILNLDTPILQAAREVAAEGYRVHFPRAYWDVSVPPRPDLPDEWWPRTRLDRELGNFYHPIGENVPMVLLNPDRLIREGAAERGRTYPLMRRSGQEATLQLIGVGATVKAGQPALLGDGTPVGTSAGFPVKLARDPDAIPIVSWTAERPPVEPP